MLPVQKETRFIILDPRNPALLIPCANIAKANPCSEKENRHSKPEASQQSSVWQAQS
jgi:hypothetical protein